MRLLLDTHTFIWWMTNDRALPASAREMIGREDNDIFLSAATAWEMAIKHKIGKLPIVAGFIADVPGAMEAEGFIELPVSVVHGQMAGALDGHHKDPFDRMLIAQALCEELTLVSNETRFDTYGVTRLW
ncbi:MAG: type II toxin-antitoxin system VapC family toxin [Parvibaculum sp.]|uniref:type II toxin-antitoxin system VapC family toxin n=1 Tax=Parvibaculum sp. TaxID=2024848 RepID=UPI002ABB528A|nr:type II toxin-antitoxin system VapC family toxin [Parvibaculum sp.]MDZ4381227.1 type II toxin-antitoxin system VapC family toxin [Parvibaculum sp.]